MKEIGLVHLVWKPAGIEACRRFLNAYVEHPAGVDHTLFVLYKGFAGDDLEEHRKVFSGVRHQELLVPNQGLDIKAYCWAAQRIDCRYLCFANSAAAPLSEAWLRMLHDQVTRPQVGAVGATGTWESHLTNYLRRIDDVGSPKTPIDWAKHINRLRKLRRYRANFRPAPNPHLRTNAFMIERSRWLSLCTVALSTKWDSWVFESGTLGMTATLRSRGETVVVVGRDGRGYSPDEWPRSATYRTAGQENLLVADNRTRQYDEADPDTRVLLSRLAWGAV